MQTTLSDEPATGVTHDAPSPAMLRRVAVASCIGSTVEWYDFVIYATASALVFNKLFFPDLSPLVGSLVALGRYPERGLAHSACWELITGGQAGKRQHADELGLGLRARDERPRGGAEGR